MCALTTFVGRGREGREVVRGAGRTAPYLRLRATTPHLRLRPATPYIPPKGYYRLLRLRAGLLPRTCGERAVGLLEEAREAGVELGRRRKVLAALLVRGRGRGRLG